MKYDAQNGDTSMFFLSKRRNSRKIINALKEMALLYFISSWSKIRMRCWHIHIVITPF